MEVQSGAHVLGEGEPQQQRQQHAPLGDGQTAQVWSQRRLMVESTEAAVEIASVALESAEAAVETAAAALESAEAAEGSAGGSPAPSGGWID